MKLHNFLISKISGLVVAKSIWAHFLLEIFLLRELILNAGVILFWYRRIELSLHRSLTIRSSASSTPGLATDKLLLKNYIVLRSNRCVGSRDRLHTERLLVLSDIKILYMSI